MMGIYDLRQSMPDVPGIDRLQMSYANGGMVQVYSIDGKEARVSATAGESEIRAALLAALAA